MARTFDVWMLHRDGVRGAVAFDTTYPAADLLADYLMPEGDEDGLVWTVDAPDAGAARVRFSAPPFVGEAVPRPRREDRGQRPPGGSVARLPLIDEVRAEHYPGPTNIRWIACHASLGKRPQPWEFMVWLSPRWSAFCAHHGKKNAREVELLLGVRACHEKFDAWLRVEVDREIAGGQR